MEDSEETVIETARLRLRRLNDADQAKLHDFYQSPEVVRFIGGPPPPLAEFVAAQRRR
jgi:RimJ/RimL family protein N-acetyltransferase